jgi:hypothetical protein
MKRSSMSRPWCVPPAMLRVPGETMEGARILAEIPSDLGLLLWRTFRDVTLWAEAEPEARGQLFGGESAGLRLTRLAGTETSPDLGASLDTINAMLAIAGAADGEVLTICCLEVSAWARREGLVHTAIAFAQAGALASPHFAEAALQTGIAASVAGEEPRSESWLRRAVGLARREKNHAAYATGIVELGALYERRRENARAERSYRWGYRAGRIFKVPSARMKAAHGLLRLARASGDVGSAAHFALAAFRSYRPRLAGGADLLLDVARFYIEAGDLGRARAVTRRLSNINPQLLKIRDKLLTSALTARAFAETDPRFSAAAASEAWRLVSDDSLRDEVRFTAALDLAHAARTVGDLVAFTRAKGAVVRLAPAATFPQVSIDVAELWPEGQPAPPFGLAS